MTGEPSARIAFVGAGGHATASLYPNIAHIPEFDLVAVCDLDEGRAIHAARRFGALEHYVDMDKMLSAVAPDGVCVCGPPSMHHALTLHCLSRGFPVFVEKPPAPDLKGAQELVAEAKENHTFGMVGFMKRFAPANVVAREFMASEAFGDLSTVNVVHGSGPYDDVYRMMIFNGIHMIDLARFLGGDVETLSAYGNSPEAECKSVVASFRFRSGAVGSLNMNSGHNWQDCFEQAYVTGTGAALLIDASKGVEVMAADRRFANGEGLELFGWSSKYYVSGNMAGWWAGGHYTRGYWGELNHFARACLGWVEPGPTLEDGMEAMRFIEAAMTSLREEHRPVALEEIG
jgi:myo-inositol 2-dehydrogenase/D-chiro-inositol 1-dehydrogenase